MGRAKSGFEPVRVCGRSRSQRLCRCGARGSGVGTALLAALIEASEASDVWTLQAGIFPENTASVALFTKAGFRTVGHRERIGRMDGRWRDTLLFERRSRVVGTS